MRRLLPLAATAVLGVGLFLTGALRPPAAVADNHPPCTPADVPHATYHAAFGEINPQLEAAISVPRARALNDQSGYGILALVDGATPASPGELVVLARSSDGWAVQSRIPVGAQPGHITTSPYLTFVANEGSCSVTVIDPSGDGTASRTIGLPAAPGGLAWIPDPGTGEAGHLFVTEPAVGQVAVFDADFKQIDTIRCDCSPYELGQTGDGKLLVLGAGHGGHGGYLNLLDVSRVPATLLSSVDTDGATAMQMYMGSVFVVENGAHRLSRFEIDPDSKLRADGFAPLDPTFDQRHPSFATAIVPVVVGDSWGTGQALLVTLDGSSHVSLFYVDLSGAPMLSWTIEGVYNTVGATGGSAPVLVQADGRIVPIPADKLDSLLVNAPVQPPAIEYVLPGPLDVSLAPEDVARSFGITAFVMLLLGAPTPLFNSTLAENRRLIERWLRRRRPKTLRRGSPLAAVGRAAVALSRTWPGLAVYMGLAAGLYAFLDSGFPGPNAAWIFAVALAGIVAGTALTLGPKTLYVRRRYQAAPHVRVALWTLILAAFCVAITRLTAVQPGYVYGIIGGVAFNVALTREDRGRIAFRAILVLLLAGVAAWLLRVPFQPGNALGSGPGEYVNKILAGIFVNAVEAVAIAMIPLRFLDGEPIWAWSRLRWAVLWAAGLVFFAHVILYPVSSYEPNPSAVGIWTILATATTYGAIAVGFWWYFRHRERRHRRGPAAATRRPVVAEASAAAAEASAAVPAPAVALSTAAAAIGSGGSAEAAARSMSFCPFCGERLHVNARFCALCGHALLPAT